MTSPVETAAKLAPHIEAAAEAIERGRELPVDLANELGDSGLFWLLVPRSLGGAELEFPTYLEVVETLARADASVAWCVNQGAVFSTLARHVPAEAARQIWRGPRDVIANGPPPFGRAVRVDGGFRLSGRWSFSSGCRHATWLSGIAIVDDPEVSASSEGGRFPMSFLVPRDQAELIDVWDVRGLRGTGSWDFEVEDLFVPHERVIDQQAPVREPGPLYALSLTGLFACGFAAVALGVARGALDDVREILSGKVPRFSRSREREKGTVQLRFAEGEAIWGAAHAFLNSSARAAWQVVQDGTRPLPLEERVRLRLASTHTIREAARATDRAYELAGTDGIFVGHPLQRRFQDARVIQQHLQGRLSHYETAGQFYLGLDPDLLLL